MRRQSGNTQDFGPGFQVKFLETISVVPASLGSADLAARWATRFSLIYKESLSISLILAQGITINLTYFSAGGDSGITINLTYFSAFQVELVFDDSTLSFCSKKIQTSKLSQSSRVAP